MIRRLLPVEEWHRLEDPVKKCFGEDKEVPDPSTIIRCAVEEDEEGNIIGFLFLQLAAHLEPFGSLGGASFYGLKSVIDKSVVDICPGYYLHTDDPSRKAHLYRCGFTEVGLLFMGKPLENM